MEVGKVEAVKERKNRKPSCFSILEFLSQTHCSPIVVDFSSHPLSAPGSRASGGGFKVPE